MTRTSIRISLLFLPLSIFLFSCGHIFGKRVRGSGNVTTQDRSVGDFKDVEVDGAAKLLVSHGDHRSVKVEVDENLQQLIEVFMEGDKVVIREKRGYNLDPSADLKVYVTSPVYNNVDVAGACDIIGQTVITNAEDMSLVISGSGTMKMEINAPRISAEVTGSGNIDLKGETKSADLEINGSGHAHCFDLKTETTKVEINGSGSAEVFASVKLSAEVAGSGNVDYKGGAAVEQHSAGSGSVRKVD
jgi:Putative auto-transporter adhesin, head GIN domain